MTDPQRMDYPQTYPPPTVDCVECRHNELFHVWVSHKKARGSCSAWQCKCKKYVEPE